jgi:hypothetical protein
MLGRRVLVACAAAVMGLMLTGQAAAETVEVAGVKFEPTAPVAGKTLVLNGAGLRVKAIFKVYAAGLYLSAKAATPEAVYASTGPKRLQMVMLRNVDGNDLGKLFTEGIQKNASRETFAKSINGTLKLADVFSKRKRVVEGDVIGIDWIPGTGTVFIINGKAESEPVVEPEFFNAMMSIWLGKAPAEESLKEALLGQAAPTSSFNSRRSGQ